MGALGIPGESIRPEWLFEVANAVQGLVAPAPGSAGAQRVDAVFATFPPESGLEEQIKDAVLTRLTAERSAWLRRHRNGQINTSAVLGEVTDRVERLDVVVASAKQLLESDPAARWTVDVLARCVRCNRTDLELGFRRRYSMTAHAFLVVCRVDAAKALLRQTAWRLEEVAKGVGCRSKTSLFEHFRRVVHMTPAEYRRRWTLITANQAVRTLTTRMCAPRQSASTSGHAAEFASS